MVRRFILFWLVVAVLPSQIVARQNANEDFSELDSYVAQAVQDWQVPGLAIAIVKDGKTVFSRGYGVAELAKDAAVDSDTLFAIGSTTKAMTAAALAMLVDEGKVAWDDRVSEHMPSFQLHDAYVTRELTVRDLLTHRAGVGNADFLWYGVDNSASEILRKMRLVKPAYSLRAGFIYQNIMYAAAGILIEKLSGMTWESFIQRRIFDRLGMDRSVTTLEEAEKATNIASPHFRIDGTIEVIENRSVDSVAAAGSIWSCVEDMSRWMQFMLGNGEFGSDTLLKPETFAELLKPQTLVPAGQFYPTAELTKPHWVTYSLGWFQQDYQGRAVSFHTGSIDGMVAIIGLIPDEKIGVYVLANLDHAEVRHALMWKILDLYGGRGTRDWSADLLKLYGKFTVEAEKRRKEMKESRIAGTKPSLPLEEYIGTYSDPLLGEATVVKDSGTMQLRLGSRLVAELEHWHYDSFRAHWRDRWLGNNLITFVIDSSGKASRLEMDNRVYRRKIKSQ